MYQKIYECPACSNIQFTNAFIGKDHLVSNESFAVVKCDNCGLLITSPRPTDKELGKFYNSEQYISHTSKSNSIINFVYKLVRTYTLSQKYNLVKSLVDMGPVLDYGCGTGHLVEHFQKKSWKAYGFEPNQQAKDIALSRGVGNITSDRDTLPQKFNAIMLWHVLEHIPDINDTIEYLKQHLNKKGRIFIAVPNHLSYDADHYKEKWAAYDLPRHLYHFNPHTMKTMMKRHKMKIKSILPMRFDSFYVSMLSEKYIKGKNNFYQAIKIGYKSNQEAKRTNQYSSLIYIIKK